MGFSVRRLQDHDYSDLCKWWKAWRWTPPERDFLPEDGTGGLMVEKDGVGIVAGFIYFTNSRVCWSEFLISNFEYKEPDRKEAIRILITELNALAKQKGYRYVYTVVKNANLEKTYKEEGYLSGSSGVNELVKIL